MWECKAIVVMNIGLLHGAESSLQLRVVVVFCQYVCPVCTPTVCM